jgi:hypothetical protein
MKLALQIAENYTYKNKSYNGRFPIFVKEDNCKFENPLMADSISSKIGDPAIAQELMENEIFLLANETHTLRNPVYINNEKNSQKIINTF